MNRKVIKSILNKKLNDWTKSIKDPEVQKLCKKNSIVTGGCIASMLLNEEAKDYDVYFRDKETAYRVAKYYVDEFNKAHVGTEATVVDGEKLWKGDQLNDRSLVEQFGVKTSAAKAITPDRVVIYIRSNGVAAEKEELLNSPFEDAVEAINDADQVDEKMLETVGEKKDPYRPVFLSSNAITLADKIQLVIRFYGEVEELHKNYDFVHCTNSFDYGKNELVLKSEALECLLNKQLKYVGSKYPLCSVIRTRKFIKRGFHIDAGQFLKMLFQVSQLDLTDINVLEEQLIGVDSSFFVQLIQALRSKQEADSSFKVEESYVASIIDKIF